MVDVDALETFDYENWKVGRRFIHLESSEILKYQGVVTSPMTFQPMIIFTGSDGLRLEYTEEFFDDLSSREKPFAEMEEYTSIRPLSIGSHNFIDKDVDSYFPISNDVSSYYCPYVPVSTNSVKSAKAINISTRYGVVKINSSICDVNFS